MLTTGIFPDDLKVAKVIPLFKKGKKEILDNYRPISLLRSLSKIFERLIFNQMLRSTLIGAYPLLFCHVKAASYDI